MGNGTSHSVMLTPGTRSLGHSVVPARYERSPARYAHPNNRVLPKPIAGQRLRSTDNGHILHSAGTIRGRKSTSPSPMDNEEADPEVTDILKRRSEMIEKDHMGMNFRGYRMFHSDTDISQSRPLNGYSPDLPETLSSRRTSGGVASKANKLKQRKKTRAPEPPPQDSFHNQFQRRSQSSTDLSQDRNCLYANGLPDWKSKNRAPPPPPPPKIPQPPPLPQSSKKPTALIPPKTSNSTDRPHESRGGRSQITNLSRSVGDLSLSEDQRNTVFDSRAALSKSNSKPPLMLQPDPFQKEIEAVTKKIARERDFEKPTKLDEESSKVSSPKPYYFSDKDVFKTNSSKKSGSVSPIKEEEHVNKNGFDNIQNRPRSKMNGDIVNSKKDDQFSVSRNSESPLERFSPNRRRIKSPMRQDNDSYNRHNLSLHHNGNGSDIDIRLRPVLPRKTQEVGNFSAIEAWQALGTDRHNSPNSEESIPYYTHETNGMGNQPRYDYCGSQSTYNCSLIGSQWTPRQDLEDSDTSSLNSVDAVVPKSQLGEFSTRFSLPTVMFSNMRPIGSDMSTPKRTINNYRNFYQEDSPNYAHSKKKVNRNIFGPSDVNPPSHFRKFWGMRNRYMSEEDVCVSDSNWTFGGYGLQQQKRSKQYASDMMLSDKGKYELVVKNDFGELLGDILVTKSEKLKKNAKRNTVDPDISFYSTEGHVMYLPESGNYDNCSTGCRTSYNRFDPTSKKFKKISDFEKSTSTDLVRMLEDDARRRRSKEKMSIRKQLQMMKRLNSGDIETDDEEEDEADEAYFTEPKSLDGSSPLYYPSRELRYHGDMRREMFNKKGFSPLTHWTSSPALLEVDVSGKTGPGFLSSSSVNSSPDPAPWQKPANVADRWLQRKQQAQSRRYVEKQRRVSEGDSSPAQERREHCEKTTPQNKAPSSHGKEKKTSIYKQLMDIVRKEERAMKKEQGESYDPSTSRESSYSQRESSHSSLSHDSVSSSYSDSSGQGISNHKNYGGKSGIPANNEFHAATGLGLQQRSPTILEGRSPQPFHVAIAQPFGVNKGYRPVPFDISVPSASGACRMPVLQGHKVSTEVS